MNINQLPEQYSFHDGAIKSFYLDIQNSTAEIEMLVRRIISRRPSGQIQENDLVPCILRLTFEDLLEVSLFNKLPTQGYYIGFCSFKENDQAVGISINVHDSSNYVYEKDNWLVKAKSITWKEVEGSG